MKQKSILLIALFTAGAPYYAQEQTTWTKKHFGLYYTTCIGAFRCQWIIIDVQVINPDTLKEISHQTTRP